MNPWTQLAQTNFYKDIDENFLQLVEMLEYLSPLKENDLDEKFLINVDLGNKEPAQRYHIGPSEQKSLEYNFNDFLINKLVENFRRIYAIENTNKRSKNPYGYSSANSFNSLTDSTINPHDSFKYPSTLKSPLNSLLEQQKNIYNLIEKTLPFIKFDNTCKIYPRSLMGKNHQFSSFEIMTYLGLHSSLQDNHFNIHKRWLEKAALNIDDEPDTTGLKIMKKVFYSPERAPILEIYLEKHDINTIFSDLKSYDTFHQSYVICLINMFEKNDFHISNDQKITLLDKFFSNNVLSFVTPEKMNEFEQKFKKLIHDLPVDELLNTRPIGVFKPEGKLFIKYLEKTQSKRFLLDVLSDEILGANYKQKVISKFDFNDEKIIQQLLEKAFSTYSSNKAKITLTSTLPYIKDYLTKDHLAYIVSKEPSLYSMIKPYYMNLKYEQTLANKESSKTILKKI